MTTKTMSRMMGAPTPSNNCWILHKGELVLHGNISKLSVLLALRTFPWVWILACLSSDVSQCFQNIIIQFNSTPIRVISFALLSQSTSVLSVNLVKRPVSPIFCALRKASEKHNIHNTLFNNIEAYPHYISECESLLVY